MNNGYTVVFSSIYDGTLYGRWPTAAVMASLLPLADKRGEIDMSIEAICGRTGWPRDLLLQGIHELMDPDLHSRTRGHDGVRLELIDPERPWGWRFVNHAAYREKARLMAKNAAEIASGKNRDRLKDRRRPPTTADDRPADADADADANYTDNKIPPSADSDLWSDGLRLALTWKKRTKGTPPVFGTEALARTWLGSMLKTGTWAEVGRRGEHCRISQANREAKLLEILRAAGDKRDPKSYIAGAIRNLVQRHQTMAHSI